MTDSNKRPAPAYPRHTTGGKAPRCQLEHAAGGAASPASAASAASAVPNCTVYDALKKADEESARALNMYALHHGTRAQVCEAINGFFRTDEGKDHSCAYAEKDDGDILGEMEKACKELGVPKARWFWTNNDLDDDYSDEEPDIQDYWDQADDLQVSVARLAWLMENDEDE